MNLDKIRGWYAKPPRNNDIPAWNEIHAAMGTPGGSDAQMRAWALQRMGQMLLEEAKRNKCDCGQIEHGRHHMDCPAVTCNKVAGAATIAQPNEIQGCDGCVNRQFINAHFAGTSRSGWGCLKTGGHAIKRCTMFDDGAATIAQDAPQGQPSAEPVQSVESRLAETVERLEAMRKDLAWLIPHALAGMYSTSKIQRAEEIAKKWGLQ